MFHLCGLSRVQWHAVACVNINILSLVIHETVIVRLSNKTNKNIALRHHPSNSIAL